MRPQTDKFKNWVIFCGKCVTTVQIDLQTDRVGITGVARRRPTLKYGYKKPYRCPNCNGTEFASIKRPSDQDIERVRSELNKLIEETKPHTQKVPPPRVEDTSLADEVVVAERKLKTYKPVGSDKDEQVRNLVLTTSGLCAGIACLPNPIPDFFVLTPIQMVMAVKIGAIRGISLSREEAMNLLTIVGKCLGFGYVAQQGILSAYRYFIPFLGAVTTLPMVFGATFGIGTVVDTIICENLKKKTPDGKFSAKNLELNNEEVKRAYKAGKAEGQRLKRSH